MKSLPTVFFLVFILVTALGFRTYRMLDHFGLAFDQDLAAWIVRDIVVNHHPRLIGQLTSTDGVFIGPLYYYLQIPFFWLTKMDISAILWLPIVLGVITTYSYYWVFSRLFKQTQAGLIAAFLHACLLPLVMLDRWAVPTVTTALWSVWYLWGLWEVLHSRFKALILLAVLVALMWHIQLALLPLAILSFLAIWLSGAKPKKQDLLLAGLAAVAASLPLLIFELRHDWSQTLSLLAALAGQSGHGIVGWPKFVEILRMIGRNIAQFLPVPLFIFLSWWIWTKQLLKKKLLVIMLAWVGLLIISFSLNNKTISEYYFHSLNVVYVAIMTGGLLWLNTRHKWLGLLVIGSLFIINFRNLINYPYNPTGYNEKNTVTQFIQADMQSKGLECFAISFITDPGANVGYRYLFWRAGLKTMPISDNSPVYTIVMPWTYTPNAVTVKYGLIGVIPPPEKKYNSSLCGQDLNTTYNMLGFVN